MLCCLTASILFKYTTLHTVPGVKNQWILHQWFRKHRFMHCNNNSNNNNHHHHQHIERRNLSFLQFPHCANCLQHVRSSGLGEIVCTSCATQSAYTCNLSVSVTGWDGKFDLHFVSECGSIHSCRSRSIPRYTSMLLGR